MRCGGGHGVPPVAAGWVAAGIVPVGYHGRLTAVLCVASKAERLLLAEPPGFVSCHIGNRLVGCSFLRVYLWAVQRRLWE